MFIFIHSLGIIKSLQKSLFYNSLKHLIDQSEERILRIDQIKNAFLAVLFRGIVANLSNVASGEKTGNSAKEGLGLLRLPIVCVFEIVSLFACISNSKYA